MVSRPATSARVRVVLACSVCGSRNYKRTRVRRDGSAVLELRKFCKACGVHTVHVESH